jgi:3-phenylpropionate/trans-cinnamate dioxygenase ferredoxin reductase subunit
MTDPVLIIGASHAAAQLCASLRQFGWEGEITLVSDEDHLPYHRPPLSKALMSGEPTLDDILIRPPESYAQMEVTLKLGQRATSIDRESKTVTLQNGDILPYSKLALTTGARVRRLPVPGEDLPSVYYLRNQADALAISTAVAPGKRAVIIGGGYIGLEVAASLRKLKLEVTVLEAQERILERVTIPAMSDFYRRIHSEEGVEIVEGASATAISRTSTGLQVSTDTESYPADIVIIGIGVIPNTELAEAADLTIGDSAARESGIRVNAFGQTSDPDIYAAGDVAWHYSPIYDRHMRVESVPNATEMAKTVAAHICTPDTAEDYAALPWFWSDQFDLKLQIAGLSQGHTDYVVRGDLDFGRSVAVFYFDHDRLLAVDAVNSPRAFMFARQALTRGFKIDKAALADNSIDLKATLKT